MTDAGDRGPASDAGGLAGYLLRAIRGDAKGPVAGLARAGLRAFSWGYLGAVNGIALAHRVGLRRRDRAAVPVISVGNLSVGGTGKSTTTAAIAEWLRDAGLRPAVLSRGYGARRTPPPTPPDSGGVGGGIGVVSDGERVLLSPDEGGDEPVMLARRLAGVPVLIGRRRPLTARAAVERFGAGVCVLDDGFQVRNLVKDLEIVLLDSHCPFDNGFVLPRGMLREPPEHLKRADVVVLMEPQRARPAALGALRDRVRSLAPHVLLVEARRAASRLWDLADGRESPPETLRGAAVVALSGIGSPAGFEGLLREMGADVYPMRLPDHHRYTAEDVERLLYEVRKCGASSIVTTDKDAVKLAAMGCPAPDAEPLPRAAADRRTRRRPRWGHPVIPDWGLKGGEAPAVAECEAPAGRANPAPGFARCLAAHGAPPVRVLSIRLQFLAGEDLLKERLFAASREARRA